MRGRELNASIGLNNTRPTLPLLRPFTPKEKFPPNEALEDRLELFLGRWNVYSDDAAGFSAFKNRLQGPADGEEETAFGKGRTQSQLFIRSESTGKHRNNLKFRHRTLYEPDGTKRVLPALFDGWLSFGRTESDPEGYEFKSLCCMLNVNLQRFIRHQPRDDQECNAVRRLRSHKERVRERTDDRSEFNEEFSFDGNDNWIPNTPEWQAFARSHNHLHLENLFLSVMDSVESDMGRALRDTPSASRMTLDDRSEYHALRVIETGWEFASDNPIEDVVFYGERFMSFAKEVAHTRLYQMPKSATREKLRLIGKRQRRRNSPCYEIPLKGGGALRLYAKTNKRIRMEVSFKVEKDFRAKMLHSVNMKPHPSDKGKVNYRPDEELYKTLTGARQHASKLLNSFLERYRKCYGTVTRPFSAFEFMSAVATAIPSTLSEEKRRATLSMLVPPLIFHQGWFSAIPSAMKTTFIHLKKAGVLHYDNELKVHTIGSKYRAAVHALRKLSGMSSLAVMGTRRGTKPIRQR